MGDQIRQLLLTEACDAKGGLRENKIDHGAGGKSRREFLKEGALGFAFIATGSLWQTRPYVEKLGRRLAVRFAGMTWEIDPALFGPSAIVKWGRRQRGIIIDLRHAILPGTNLRVAFSAHILNSSGRWQIKFAIPGMDFRDTVPLAKWMSGQTHLCSQFSYDDFVLGGERVSFCDGCAKLALSPNFRFSFGSDSTSVRLSSPGRGVGRRLVLQPQMSTNASFLSHLEGETSRPCTVFSLDDVQVADLIALTPGTTYRGVGFKPEKSVELRGEAYDSTSGNIGVIVISAEGSLGTIQTDSVSSLGSSVRLDHAAVMITTGPRKVQSAIGGFLTQAQRVNLGSACISISRNEGTPVYARFGPSNNRSLLIQASLQELTLPIEDADFASIRLPGHPVDLVMNWGDRKQKASAVGNKKPETGSIVVAGTTPIAMDAMVQLDQATLVLRRSADLLNLSFKFEGFELRIRNGIPVLLRRRSKARGRKWMPASVTVCFPPQHIAEEWFSYQDPTTIPPSSQDQPDNSRSNASRSTLPKLPDVMRSRLSGESRIVFHVNDELRKRPPWVERPITVDALTDWSDLALSVNERALGPGKSVEEQLCIPQIGASTKFDDAVSQVASKLQPPGALETALEMSGRLIFSPSIEARWLVPRERVNPKDAVLWHARLDEVGRQTVRAIWSNWILPGQFPITQGKRSKEPARDPLLVLSPLEHWEIVAQTSLYGLIALRNLEDNVEQKQSFLEKWNPFSKSPERTRNIPRNRVVRPQTPYVSLDYVVKQIPPNQKPYQPEDIGFALAEPFEDANVILTSIGGSLSAEWNGEPFVTPVPFNRLPPTFNLERFIYRSQLGRDIHVETYTKGYLLPLGIRASYVSLSERRFFPHPRFGYPVAYLVKRAFIVVRQPEKNFPAVSQQYQSRDFPVSRVRMITKTTPDLRSPDELTVSIGNWKSNTGVQAEIYPNGLVKFSGADEHDLVFWPRVTDGIPGTKGDVQFKWSLDDDHTPTVSNLLFVSNSVSRNRELSATVAEYYRGLGAGISASDTQWHPLRTAQLFGTRRQYAPSRRDSETAFDTDSWLLSTRGPADASGTKEEFRSTGMLVRADQPPFYPVVERAKIAVQSLDRLIGSPQGLLQAQFYPSYVASGFDSSPSFQSPPAVASPGANPSEIFLEVLSPRISLNANGNGAATGALAKPNATLAALSRSIGLIGGCDPGVPCAVPPQEKVNVQRASILSLVDGPSSSQTQDVTNSQAALLTGPQPTPSQFNFASAQKGTFDPNEFFDDSAKLLGLIKLKDLIKAVEGPSIKQGPKLLETIGYDRANQANTLKDVSKLLTKAAEKINGIRTAINERLATIIKAQPFATDLKFDALYPGLSQSINEFSKLTQDFAASANVAELADILFSGQHVLAELQKILQDPVPETATSEIGKLAKQWETLKSFPQRWLSSTASEFIDQFRSFLTNLSARASTLNLQAVLFGADVSLMMNSPGAWLSQAENALFSSTLTKPLAAAAVQLKSIQGDFSTERVAQTIQQCLKALGNTVEFVQVARAGAFLRDWIQTPRSTESPKVVSFAYEAAAGLLLTDAVRDPNSITSKKIGLFAIPKVLQDSVSQLKLNVDRSDLKERLAACRTEVAIQTQEFAKVIDDLRIALQGDRDQKGTIEGLEQIRKDFEGAHHRELYRDLGALMNPVTTITGLREAAAKRLKGVCTQLKELQSIFRDADDAAQVGLIDSLAKSLSDVCLGITSVSQVADASPSWKFVRAQLQSLAAELADFQTFKGSVQNVRESAEQTAAGLRSKLNQVNTVDGLLVLLDSVATYSSDIDHQITSLGLQSIALPWMDAAVVLQTSSRIIIDVVALYATLHQEASGAITAVRNAVGTSVLKFLVDPGLLARLDQIAADLAADAQSLNTIASHRNELAGIPDLADLQQKAQGSSDSRAASELLATLRQGADKLESISTKLTQLLSNFLDRLTNKDGPGLLRSISILNDIIDNILHSNLADVFNRSALRPIVAGIVSDLRDTLAQVVPARTDLGYNWCTQLGSHSLGNFLSFDMKTPSAGVAGQGDQDTPAPHFMIKSNATVNFITGDRHWSTQSKLGAFRIQIMKDLVTLYFESAEFTSSDIAEAHLSVRFTKAETGPQLKFLEALKAFMAPSAANGPYVEVRPNYIAAGYRFDMGVIQVGSLQFIHVSLQAFANLPLKGADGDLAAQIGFGFGSEARPFLIAQPPYGGGGYVHLLYDGKLNKLVPRISLSFGAVVAIKFGPLDGHGRVTATITWGKSNHGKGDLIRASVEAVGEGHIACFGIAVMLQVAIEEEEDRLTGFAHYSFEFSVGFLSVSFSFDVKYTISGGQGAQSQSSGVGAVHEQPITLLAEPRIVEATFNEERVLVSSLVDDKNQSANTTKQCCYDSTNPETRRIKIVAPRKASAWRDYRKRLSMELLAS